MILDTCFLIDLLKNNKDAVAKAQVLDETDTPSFATTVTVFELWQGVHDASEEERERVLTLLSSVGIHVLDFEGAKQAGEIFDILRREGQKIEPEDCLIAGIARSHNEPVLTRNVKHFSLVKNMRYETY